MDDKLARLHEICGDHLDQVRKCFKEPVKLTIFVRNPAWPNGARDVLVSDDDPQQVAVAILQVAKMEPLT